MSRRAFLAFGALGALLSAILPKSTRALPDPDALIEHQGWVLRADDLQRLDLT